MGSEKTNTTKLGFFVIAALSLFAVAVYNIGNQQNLFGGTFGISTVFHNVNGLKAGNNVRFSGINVGMVETISIINDSTIQVNMQVENKVKPFLKKDALASIGTDGLVGNVIVNISPGKSKLPAVEDGDMIQSYSRIETDDMLATLGHTTENIALLAINLLEITENINNGQGSVSTLLNDTDLSRDLQIAMRNLRNTTQHIQSLSSQFQSSMHAVDQGEGILGYLLKDTTFENEIHQITQHLDSLIQFQARPFLEHLEQSGKDIASSSAAVKELISEINLNEGVVGTMLRDSTLSKDLKQTIQNLNKGSDLINQNMEALKHNFLFRRYFRQQEKKLKKAQQKSNALVQPKISALN